MLDKQNVQLENELSNRRLTECDVESHASVLVVTTNRMNETLGKLNSLLDTVLVKSRKSESVRIPRIA
jgi:hypothetical protein